MEIWVTLAIVVGVVLVGFVLYPLLKSKGWFTKNELEGAELALTIAQIIVGELNFKNSKQVEILLQAADKAVKYVEQTEKYTSNNTKKALAIAVVFDYLNLAGIDITERIEELVEISVEAAVNSLPPTYKK